MVCQIWHCGRVSHASYQPEGQAPLAPSALACPEAGAVTNEGPKVPRDRLMSSLCLLSCLISAVVSAFSAKEDTMLGTGGAVDSRQCLDTAFLAHPRHVPLRKINHADSLMH